MKISITKKSDNKPLRNSTLSSDTQESIIINLQHPNLNINDYDFVVTLKINDSDLDSNAVIIKSTEGQGDIEKILKDSSNLQAIFSLDLSDFVEIDESATFYYHVQMFTKNPQSSRTIQRSQINIKPSNSEVILQWTSQD